MTAKSTAKIYDNNGKCVINVKTDIVKDSTFPFDLPKGGLEVDVEIKGNKLIFSKKKKSA